MELDTWECYSLRQKTMERDQTGYCAYVEIKVPRSIQVYMPGGQVYVLEAKLMIYINGSSHVSNN